MSPIIMKIEIKFITAQLQKEDLELGLIQNQMIGILTIDKI